MSQKNQSPTKVSFPEPFLEDDMGAAVPAITGLSIMGLLIFGLPLLTVAPAPSGNEKAALFTLVWAATYGILYSILLFIIHCFKTVVYKTPESPLSVFFTTKVKILFIVLFAAFGIGIAISFGYSVIPFHHVWSPLLGVLSFFWIFGTILELVILIRPKETA